MGDEGGRWKILVSLYPFTLKWVSEGCWVFSSHGCGGGADGLSISVTVTKFFIILMTCLWVTNCPGSSSCKTTSLIVVYLTAHPPVPFPISSLNVTFTKQTVYWALGLFWFCLPDLSLLNYLPFGFWSHAEPIWICLSFFSFACLPVCLFLTSPSIYIYFEYTWAALSSVCLWVVLLGLLLPLLSHYS